jgi:hypothetical protein
MVTGASEQVQPKMVPAPGGGFYMSWYDNRAGGYDPYVQRFNANGFPLWPSPGVQVADTAFSSTEDYGLTVDGAGNAVLVFRDDRLGGVKITAQAVSPAGNLLWGALGVQMPSVGGVNSPKAGVGTDGVVYAGWTDNGKASVLRLDGNGAPLWATPFVITDGSSATYILSDLQAGEDGSIIASCVRYLTFNGAKVLHTQKLSMGGLPQWPGTTVPVFTTGSVQTGNFPTFLPDGAGGGVFSFYTVSPLQSFVQWVAPNGTLKFGTNGAAVTPSSAGMNRTNPAVAFDAESGRVYANWIEQIPNSSNYGVAAQAFDGTGARLWGSAGAVTTYVQPIASVYDCQQARAVMMGGRPVLLWVTASAFGVQTVSARGLNADGSTAWGANTVALPPGGKSRLAAMRLASGSASAVVWEGTASGGADLFGQRLNQDGSLGVPGDLNGDAIVDGADLGTLLGGWGSCVGCEADMNGDGTVDGADLGTLLGAWSI